MRVLVISAAYPPMMAPEADHAFHLCERLACGGLEVDVLTTKGSESCENGRVRVHPVMRDWSWSDVPRLARHVRKCDPDAVLLMYLGWAYNQHPMITFVPSIIRTLLRDVTIVTQIEDRHGILSTRCSTTTRVIRKAVTAWAGPSRVDYAFGTLLRGSDRIIVLSDIDRVELAAHHAGVNGKSVLIPCPPILNVRPGDSGESRRQGRQTLGVGSEQFLFAYFGYAYEGKGIETLFRAFEQVVAMRPESRLAMIGGDIAHARAPGRPSYAQEMRDLTRQLGIEDTVRWTGKYPWDSDIGSMYLRAADACVFPFDEGVYLYNSSLAAAAVHGLPLIATEGRLREQVLIHRENVFLCPSKSVEALCEAMMTVLDDRELRTRLCAGAAKLAADCFSWQRTVDRTIATLTRSA